MNGVEIGSIIGRLDEKNNRPLTLAHLVESVVNEGPFTRCGKAMAPREGTKFGSMPGRRCKVCFPHQRI